MDDDIVTTLEVKSFAGFVPGTEHFYGDLCGSVDGVYKRIDVKGRLTEYEAVALNRVDSWQGHKEGMLSIRFSKIGRAHV